MFFSILTLQAAEIPISHIRVDLSTMKKLHLKHNHILSPLLLFPHIYSIFHDFQFVIMWHLTAEIYLTSDRIPVRAVLKDRFRMF